MFHRAVRAVALLLEGVVQGDQSGQAIYQAHLFRRQILVHLEVMTVGHLLEVRSLEAAGAAQTQAQALEVLLPAVTQDQAAMAQPAHHLLRPMEQAVFSLAAAVVAVTTEAIPLREEREGAALVAPGQQLQRFQEQLTLAAGAAEPVKQLRRTAGPVALESSSLSTLHNMGNRKYQLFGVDVAMEMLRPNAKWEIANNVITRWDDPRPKPSIEEVYWVMEKIKAFEDSIPTIWLPEQQPQEV